MVGRWNGARARARGRRVAAGQARGRAEGRVVAGARAGARASVPGMICSRGKLAQILNVKRVPEVQMSSMVGTFFEILSVGRAMGYPYGYVGGCILSALLAQAIAACAYFGVKHSDTLKIRVFSYANVLWVLKSGLVLLFGTWNLAVHNNICETVVFPATHLQCHESTRDVLFMTVNLAVVFLQLILSGYAVLGSRALLGLPFWGGNSQQAPSYAPLP